MQKIKAVLDTNTVISGMFWRGDARKCLLTLAQRKFNIAASPDIFYEYQEIALKVKRKTGKEPLHCLGWLESIAEMVEPAPIKKLSRDSGDNIFVGCALAAGAGFVVTRDKDLLVLKKPFGIEIVTPRGFLRKISLHH